MKNTLKERKLKLMICVYRYRYPKLNCWIISYIIGPILIFFDLRRF